MLQRKTRILSWSGDHTVRLWDVATGQTIGPAMKHDCWVSRTALVISSTNKGTPSVRSMMSWRTLAGSGFIEIPKA
jgi:hypothetical protein